jgi:antitoxin component YwqK of YwqJK toxin-antitoxin module
MSVANFIGIRFISLRVIVMSFSFLLIHEKAGAQSPKKERINTHYANGGVKEKGKKKDGLKHGTWLIYNQEGWLEQRIKYKNDLAIWQVFYDSKQRKVKMIDKNGIEVPYKGCNCKN